MEKEAVSALIDETVWLALLYCFGYPSHIEGTAKKGGCRENGLLVDEGSLKGL